MRILVFGKTGQVGSGLLRDLQQLGTVRCVGRETADLTDLAAVENAIRDDRPDLVINAAAYTHVDQAEKEPELADLVNAKAPAVMAEMTAAINAWFIHYSTDYVFDGESTQPYTENMATSPNSIYGRSKAAGEDGIKQVADRYLILRTSWVYSNSGRNFLNTILRLAKQQQELRIVDDQTGTPTYSRALSTNTAAIVKKLTEDWDNQDRAGIFNMTCQGSTTWYGFACEIFRLAGIEDVDINPITTREFPTPAKRPQYSVLDNSKLEKVFGVQLPDWRDSLKECLAQRAFT